MRYFKKITGEKVYLSPINPDDYEIYTKWLNDPEVGNYTGFRSKIVGLQSERSALEKMSASGYNFAIINADNDELIGNISFMDTNTIDRHATLGIFIGEPQNRSRGFGAEAIQLLLKYGFDTLNLHNVILLVDADNERGIACYKKVGFREFGRRRESTYKNGCYHDTIYMDILKHEFREKYGK